MAVEERNLIAPGAGLTAAPPVVGRFSDFVYQLRGNPATFAGLFIVVVIVLSALLGPVLARYDPYAVDLGQSAVHLTKLSGFALAIWSAREKVRGGGGVSGRVDSAAHACPRERRQVGDQEDDGDDERQASGRRGPK